MSIEAIILYYSSILIEFSRLVIHQLKEFNGGCDVYEYDPLVPDEVNERFGANFLSDLDGKVDEIIIVVGHRDTSTI